MPWPDGPPSSDCPVGWHTDDAPRRHRVRTSAMSVYPLLVVMPSTISLFVSGWLSCLKPCRLLRMGFETGPCPKPGCESACFPQGLFPPPKTRPWVFRRLKKPVFIENLGIACPHSRRGFFRPQKTRPWFFCGHKGPFLAPGTRRPLPGGAHIKSDPTTWIMNK